MANEILMEKTALNTPKHQGQRLIDLRKQTHLSRRAFALKHGISPGSLQNWESGRYQGLTKSAIDKLLQAFRDEGIECSVEWFLYGKPPTPMKLRGSRLQLSPYSIKENNRITPMDVIELTNSNAEKHAVNMMLYNATIAGRYAEVVRLINEAGSNLHLLSGIAIHLYDNHENSLLHVAARNGNLSIVEFLIDNGTKVNVTNRRKHTPLHWASHNGHCEIVDYLIKKGASIDAVEDEGGTPLSWAAYVGQLEVAKQLLKFGAYIHSSDQNSNTPLHWACYHGRLDIVKFLVEKDADLSKKNSSGLIPLDIAVENGHTETVKFLLNC